ncbi:MAG: LON peptidase substrate-binding domain-containing protein [Alphaproteobacteria bacterium]|nr:LON peptidase substrate-binding domain-containing protein [Alphaproteobacteria bacterium]MDA7982933.1 LON peptidase substrate-binding domain-containing protein [Alphaproteobacteria bacterium]MDA7989266.1 LON peptidase substrate-binding domain-containing protein [Alphaproteobacteria bacterium]MDA8009534.1 LON peptidase substrate-binding domain-containing protein [Alphaproteobacteria bacterium]
MSEKAGARGAALLRPEEMPLFVLDEALLLPTLQLSLQVFEPRYIALTDYVLARPDRMMGIIRPRGEGVEDDGEAGLYDVGCAGRIMRFAESDDGRYIITLDGVARFRRVRCLPPREGYRRALVDWSPYAHDRAGAGELRFDRARFALALEAYLDSRDLAGEWESFARVPLGRLVDAMAGLCPFSPEEKQALLEAVDTETRCEIIVALFEIATAPGSARVN